MHVKRRVAAVLAVLCLLGACILGNRFRVGDSEGNPSVLPVFGKKETIYFWYSDESMSSFFNSAAVAFGQEHDVRVIPVLAEESEYLEAINQASLHTDRIPDVYMISNESLEKAYMAGLASPIEDEGNICTTAYFPQTALSAVTYHDKLVAYPFSFETSVLVYNESYLTQWAEQQVQRDYAATEEEEFSEVQTLTLEERKAMAYEDLVAYYRAQIIPDTVDHILYIGNSFDVPEGVEGIMKWDVSDIFYNYWIVGEYMVVGGDAGDEEENISIHNAEAIQCLEVYKALNQFFYIESDTVNFESVVQDFIDGKIVYTIATTDAIQKLETAKKEGTLAYEYGFAVMPDVSSKLKSRSLSVTSAVAVNGYSENKELANTFAAYLVQECSRDLYERTGKVPANHLTNADNEAVQIYRQEYADSISLCKMMSTSNFWIELEAMFSEVWNGGDVSALVQELSELIQAQINGVTH